MKILYLSGGINPIKDPAPDKLRKLGHEVEFFDVWADKEDSKKWVSRHFQIYQKLLDKVEKENFDVLYFASPVAVPEYLNYELKARPNFKAKIIIQMLMRGINRSLARAIALRELIENPLVHKVIMTTMLVRDIKLPTTFIESGLDKLIGNKIILNGEAYPAQEDPALFDISREEARKIMGFKQEDFIALFSGSWVYIKGADLLVECSKYIDDDIKLFIHRHSYAGADLDFNLTKEIVKNHENTIVIDKWFKEREIAPMYRSANLLICPHRRSYEYGESGEAILSSLAKIPLVAPNFYFFSEIINRYKVGVLYEPENPKAMAEAINFTKKNYSSIIKNAKFKESGEDTCGDQTDLPSKVGIQGL